ncbi:MAG: hypothetical protein NVSMB64_28560 [Candidatus Velthaea sp.]
MDIIRLSGELDISRYPDVCEILAHAPPGLGPVLLDLRELVLIDSLCLSELLLFHHRMEDDGRNIAAVVSDAKLYRIFALANVIELLNVYQTLDDAIEALELTAMPPLT